MSSAPEASTSTRGNNNNKFGKNQYKDRPTPDDPQVAAALQTYYRKGITDRKKISKLLLEEHGITLSESSIARRKKKLGLRNSHLTTLEMSDSAKRQLILDQMAKDPTGRIGPRTVKLGIFADTAEGNSPFFSDYIRDEMMKLDPVSYSARGPAHAKVKRQRRLEAHVGSTLSNSAAQDPQHLPLPLLNVPTQKRYEAEARTEDANVDPRSETSSDNERGNDYDVYQHDFNITENTTARTSPPPPTTTSPCMVAAMTYLQEATPKMEELTRFLNSVNASDEALDSESYDFLSKGMESATLLERQLSRVLSQARRIQR